MLLPGANGQFGGVYSWIAQAGDFFPRHGLAEHRCAHGWWRKMSMVTYGQRFCRSRPMQPPCHVAWTC